MSIKKEYTKNKTACKVTFVLPKKATNGAKSVSVVGDFNNWDSESIPMKRLKNGGFEAIINLKPNQEYQFRYLIDGTAWENDPAADKYIPTPYNSENSVVVI